jgi:hypothetical protein
MLDLSCITNNSTKEKLTPKQTRFQLVEIYLGVINNIALLQTKTNESISLTGQVAQIRSRRWYHGKIFALDQQWGVLIFGLG